MKNLLRLLALSLVITLSCSVAFAQHKEASHKMRSDSAYAKLAERLKLTPDQQVQLKTVMKQNREEMKAVREASKDAEKTEKRKAMMAQMKRSDERISALLSETQKAEYDKIKQEKKAEMKARKAQKPKHKPQGNANDELMNEGLL